MPKGKYPPSLKRPMIADELEIAKCLRRVTYPPASFDKRFARAISSQLDETPPTITDRQAPQLWRLAYRYRRQIIHPDRVRLLRMAEILMAPDFRRLSASAATLRKIEKIKADNAQFAAEAAANMQSPTTL